MKWLSKPAVLWAMDMAPDVPPHLVAALVAVARYAGEDGRGAYPSIATIAAIIRKSHRNARKDLAELRQLGLLLDGDQRLVKDIRADRRPFVYDIPMSARGVAHDTPSKTYGGSHSVSTGGRTRPSGGSQATPKEVLKTSRTRSAPAAEAAAQQRQEDFNAWRADVLGRKAVAETECPGCHKPFSALVLGKSELHRQMAYAGTLICGPCHRDGFTLNEPPADPPQQATIIQLPVNGRVHGNKRQGLDQDLLRAIRTHPGATATELVALVGCTRANGLKTLSDLVSDGVVVKIRDGHKVGYVRSAAS